MVLPLLRPMGCDTFPAINHLPLAIVRDLLGWSDLCDLDDGLEYRRL